MGKYQGPDNFISELGNWNNAAIYSTAEIAKPLAMTTIYRDIAKHGYSDFISDIMNTGISKDQLRYEGLKYLVSELLKVIENSKAFLKKKGTLGDINEYEKKLKNAETLLNLPILYKKGCDRFGNISIKLDLIKFEKVLKEILDIRTEIKTPLNKNDLIFINKEEFDPKEYKQQILSDATTRG